MARSDTPRLQIFNNVRDWECIHSLGVFRWRRIRRNAGARRYETQACWSWALEYFDVLWGIIQSERAENFVIVTGEARSLLDFARMAFGHFGLNWEDHVRYDA